MQNHDEFTFWTPPHGATVKVGPEQNEVPLPSAPLPVHPRALVDGPPSEAAIGEGVYDYLRRFPDCEHNTAYAWLLRDAYPHYIADIGSNAVMLDARDVSAAYLHRKISLLKILRLLDPQNAGLSYLLGQTYFELIHEVSEFVHSREHLLASHGFLTQARNAGIEDIALYNLLGEIDYLLGDYPGARRRWRQVIERMGQGHDSARQQLEQRIRDLNDDAPVAILDEMETVGNALLEAGKGDYQTALEMLEPVAEQGHLVSYFECAQVPYMIAVCRDKLDDAQGALMALEEALSIDPNYELALAMRDRVIEGD